MSDESAASRAWRPLLARSCAVLSAALLLHHFLARSLQSAPGPDEGMYLSAASLARDHAIYSGFSYLQAPYLPLALSKALLVFGETSPLLLGRLATFLHQAVLLAVLFLIGRAYTRSSTFSVLFVLFIALQGFAFFGGATLHNSTFANAYALAAFLLFYLGSRHGHTPRLILSGASLSVAIGMKLTYAPLLGAFLLAQLPRACRHTLSRFTLGAALGATPMLVLAARDPTAFWFNNLGWHRAAMAGLSGNVRALARDLSAAFSDVTWAGPLLLLSVYLVADNLWRRERARGLASDRLILLLVPPIYLGMVIAVGQFRYWYLEPAFYFAGILIPCLYADQPEVKRRTTGALLLATTAALLLARTPSVLATPSPLARERWMSSRLRVAAESTRMAVESAGGGSVATLGELPQIYAVEAGLPLLASTPSAAFECANARMPEEAQRRFHLATLERAAREIESGTLTALAVRYVDCDGDEPRSLCDASTCEVLSRLEPEHRELRVGVEPGGFGATIVTRDPQ